MHQQLFPRFLDANPALDVRLVMQARSSATTDWMGIEEPVPPDVNVSLRLLPRTAAASDRLKLLIPEFVYPCCTPELASQIKDIADLSGHRLIEYDDGMPGLELLDASWSNWFAAAGAAPVVAQQWARVPDWSAIIMLSLSGAGVFLGRSPLVHSYLRDGSLVRCTRTIVPSTRAYFVSRAIAGEPDPAADLFIDWLCREAGSEQAVPGAIVEQ